jgi:hypothetical protein
MFRDGRLCPMMSLVVLLETSAASMASVNVLRPVSPAPSLNQLWFHHAPLPCNWQDEDVIDQDEGRQPSLSRSQRLPAEAFRDVLGAILTADLTASAVAGEGVVDLFAYPSRPERVFESCV